MMERKKIFYHGKTRIIKGERQEVKLNTEDWKKLKSKSQSPNAKSMLKA